MRGAHGGVKLIRCNRPAPPLCCSARNDPSLVAYVDGPRIVEQCGCGPSAPPGPVAAGPQAQGTTPVPSPVSGGPPEGLPAPAEAPPGTPGGAAGAPGVTQKVLQASRARAAARGGGVGVGGGWVADSSWPSPDLHTASLAAWAPY